jgi:hypothetical protein
LGQRILLLKKAEMIYWNIQYSLLDKLKLFFFSRKKKKSYLPWILLCNNKTDYREEQMVHWVKEICYLKVKMIYVRPHCTHKAYCYGKILHQVAVSHLKLLCISI